MKEGQDVEPLQNLLLESKINAIYCSRMILDWSLPFRARSHMQIQENESGQASCVWGMRAPTGGISPSSQSCSFANAIQASAMRE